MPFDNPHQTPFGDAELLWEARSRISTRTTGCRAVSKTGIVYVSSVHYRWYPVAAASIHRTEWNDGLLGSLLLSFHQGDACGRG